MLHMTSRQIEIRLRPTNPTYSLFSSRTMDFPFMTNASEVLPALMTSHPVIAIPYVFLLALFSFTGTVGNLLVIGTNLTAKKKDQMIGDAFIVNLAAVRHDRHCTQLTPSPSWVRLFSWSSTYPPGTLFVSYSLFSLHFNYV